MNAKMKNRFLSMLLECLLYVWQLPQNLIGLAYLCYCRDRALVTKQRGAVFYATSHVKGGVTLGRYVFIAVDNMMREPVYDHEYGHAERWANALGGIPDYKGEYHHHEDGLIVTCWDTLLELKQKYFPRE